MRAKPGPSVSSGQGYIDVLEFRGEGVPRIVSRAEKKQVDLENKANQPEAEEA